MLTIKHRITENKCREIHETELGLCKNSQRNILGTVMLRQRKTEISWFIRLFTASSQDSLIFTTLAGMED